MSNGSTKSATERIGCMVSSVVSDIAAHPFVQVGVVVFCGLWFLLGLPTDILTATLSILAITLTQMVLNRQNEREADAHRRDVAMHAKLDELLLSKKNARNEMAGIEELEEEEIEELKEAAEEAIDYVGAEPREPQRRETAKKAVEAVSRAGKKRSRAGVAPRHRSRSGG